MDTKKIISLLMITISLGLFAQKSKVTSTYNYLKYGELDKAKKAIDLATVHESTLGWYKTWMFRAQTYARLANQKEGDDFYSLKAGALEESIKAYKKVLTIEDKKSPVDNLKREYASLVSTAYDQGLNNYENKNFDKTFYYWELANQINEEMEINDTALILNIAIVAVSAKNTEGAIKYFDKCIDADVREAYPFSRKAHMQQEGGDLDAALNTLASGRAKYPEDQGLITQELNIYLSSGKNEEALKNLNDAIANDSNNYLYYFARASIYDNKKDNLNAETDYKKAIELNPKHFDSYFNLGASFFNKGAEMMKEAQMIPPNETKKYEEAYNLAVAELKKSVPYLEKAKEINPKDKATLNSLKTLYLQTKENEKAMAIIAELKALEAE